MNDMQGEVIEVPLEEIDRFVHQSREVFDDEVDGRLADDIKQNGMHQPVVCWLDPHRKRLVLICGERRLRASKRAENIQRASLNPIERGKAFRRLMQLEELNASEVATRMNVTVSMVSRDLSLLDLPEALQSKVAAGELPASVGAHISRIEDEETRRAFAERYRSGGQDFPAFIMEVMSMFTVYQLVRFLLLLAMGVGWMLPDVLRWRRR
jgi:ParB family chromosome partitioning protein